MVDKTGARIYNRAHTLNKQEQIVNRIGDKLVGWTCLVAVGLLIGLSQAHAAVVVVAAHPVVVARVAPVAARSAAPAAKPVSEPVRYTPAPVIVPAQPRRCNDDKDCKK